MSYKSSLGDPDWNERVRNEREDLKNAKSSGYATTFRDRSTDVDPHTNGVWIKRKKEPEEAPKNKKQKYVHHPPFLKEPSIPNAPNAEWDTAEATGELIGIFTEKESTFEEKYQDAFPGEWLNMMEPIIGSNLGEQFTTVVFDQSNAEFSQSVKSLCEMLNDYATLCRDAKQIYKWIESRENHHFQDVVNDEETIRGEVDKLEETIRGYYDDDLAYFNDATLLLGAFTEHVFA